MLLGERHFYEPVRCISSLLTNYLVIGSGNYLYQLKIDKSTRGLSVGDHIHSRFAINRIRSTGRHIVTAGHRDSIDMYELRDARLQFVSSDAQATWSVDCCLNDDMLVASDLRGNLYGFECKLFSHPAPTEDISDLGNSINASFEENVEEVIVKIQLGQLKPDFQQKKEYKQLRRFYGASNTGNIYCVRSVSKDEFDALKLLEVFLAESFLPSNVTEQDHILISRHSKSIFTERLSAFYDLSRDEQDKYYSLCTNYGIDITRRQLEDMTIF